MSFDGRDRNLVLAIVARAGHEIPADAAAMAISGESLPRI
jgi:hypothetical protein